MGIQNRGSVTVEACLVVPLFLFFMLAIADFIMLLFAEAHIHQSLAEAADYTAQYAYLEKKLLGETGNQTRSILNTAVLTKQFYIYLGEDANVEKIIQNGKYGILLSIEVNQENEKVFTARAGYFVNIHIPLLGSYHMKVSDSIKQKAFLGYGREEKIDTYVYITPNQEVYHRHRACSHLSVKVKEISISSKDNYTPCTFCGRDKNAGNKIYVSETGRVFHYRRECSGLKRTVNRVKLNEVKGLGACQRCSR